MTSGMREAVRVLIDERRRELVAGDNAGGCVRCGADLDACTAGCKACVDRTRRKLRRRTDPVYRARTQSKQNERRRRRRLAAKQEREENR